MTLPTFTSKVSNHAVELQSVPDLREALPKMVPGWSSAEVSEASGTSCVQVEPVPGGITNSIYKASLPGHTPSTALVRIFGAKDVFSPEQRAEENKVFEQLGAAGVAPRLLATFGNGRVEQFLSARPVTLDEMVSPHVLLGVARAMARLHAFRPAGWGDRQDQPAGVWGDVGGWARRAVGLLSEGKLSCKTDVAAARTALDAVQRELGAGKAEGGMGRDVVFCHNDALAGNILLGEDGSVGLVDFEYSGANYRAFDIGNLFCEAMGGTVDGVVQAWRYPGEGLRRTFCEAYLREAGGVAPEEEDVQRLEREAQRFARLAHLYWGFWALVQSASSTVDFPYGDYADQRFELFFKMGAV